MTGWQGSGNDTTLFSLLHRAAQDHPMKTAIVHAAGRTSWAELAAMVDVLAAGLASLGVARGSHVSYQLPNQIEAVVLAFALARLGAVAVPIVMSHREREIAFITDRTGVMLHVTVPSWKAVDHVALARAARDDLPLLVIGAAGAGLTAYDSLVEAFAHATPDEAPSGDADDVAVVLFTSGTTADPKGVMHTQHSIVTVAAAVAESAELGLEDRIFLASPVTLATGYLYAAALPAVVGCTVCLVDHWTPGIAGEIIERERCTWSAGATPFLQGLVADARLGRRDLSSLRAFRSGGANVPPSLIRSAWALGIRAYRAYGLTEHLAMSGRVADELERAALTDGRLHDPIEVRVVDPESGRLLPPGQTGEIQTRGPGQMLGYVDRAMEADALTPDGWLRTGDIGTVDAERFITITGRQKDIIIRKGENISAREVEDLLLDHPDIEQVAVVGLPDEQRGEMVCAVCVVRPNAEFSLSTMRDFLRTRDIAIQKFPERIEVAKELPMTPSGKIKKAELKRQIQAGDLLGDSALGSRRE